MQFLHILRFILLGSLTLHLLDRASINSQYLLARSSRPSLAIDSASLKSMPALCRTRSFSFPIRVLLRGAKIFMPQLLHLVVADAALELVPRQLWSRPAVLKTARRRGKKPGEILLDTSLHYHAMKKLPNREKRGRPDIVHICLLNALSSPLNLEGRLRVYVHTINDYVIFIDPKTRIPRNYNRFTGLMEQLLIEGRVPPESDSPLMYVKTMTLHALTKMLKLKGYIVLSERGERREVTDLAKIALREDYALVVGGFPHGEFRDEVLANAEGVFSIYDKPLDAWVVVSRVIEAAERVLGIVK